MSIIANSLKFWLGIRAHQFFLYLNADSHGVKTHQKVSFETKTGQIGSTPELPWQVEGLLTVVSTVKSSISGMLVLSLKN